MANENDRRAPAAPAAPPPVEGATKQFSLKMHSWLSALGSDLDAPAGAPPAAALEDLLQPGAPQAAAPPAEEEAAWTDPDDAVSLEAALFPSDPPPKP